MRGPKFKVGDVVRLNNGGLWSIFRCRTGLAHMKTLEMRVTQIDATSLTEPEGTYPMRVDNGDINKYMIDDSDFDLVRREANVQYEQWGSPDGRNGIQRTLDPSDAADCEFAENIRIVDANGVSRAPTIDELNEMGARRCVAAMDINTGEMKPSGTSSINVFTLKSVR